MAGPTILTNIGAEGAGGESYALNITAAAVLRANGPGRIARVVCMAAGTITLNDLATTTGGAATNELFVSPAMTTGQVIEIEAPYATGLAATAVSAGQFNVFFT